MLNCCEERRHTPVGSAEECAHGGGQVGHPGGNARPDGAQNARRDGPARVRPRGASRQISDGVLQPNQGTIYASLVRLQQRGWISGAWGVSEHNRRAKFYALTPAGGPPMPEMYDAVVNTNPLILVLRTSGSPADRSGTRDVGGANAARRVLAGSLHVIKANDPAVHRRDNRRKFVETQQMPRTPAFWAGGSGDRLSSVSC